MISKNSDVTFFLFNSSEREMLPYLSSNNVRKATDSALYAAVSDGSNSLSRFDCGAKLYISIREMKNGLFYSRVVVITDLDRSS